jgi:hypothetical protein
MESPDIKSVIISAHGMLPILEILETCNPKRYDIILRLLKVVNAVRVFFFTLELMLSLM